MTDAVHGVCAGGSLDDGLARNPLIRQPVLPERFAPSEVRVTDQLG